VLCSGQGQDLKIISKETQKKLDLQERTLRDNLLALEEKVAQQSVELKRLSEELVKKLLLEQQVTELEAAKVKQLNQLTLQQAEIAKLNIAIDEKIQEIVIAKDDVNLALNQMHLVQEQLEEIFLREKDCQSTLSIELNKSQELAKEKIELEQKLQEFEKLSKTLTQEKSDLTKGQSALKQENTDLAEAINLLVNERAKLNAELSGVYDQLKEAATAKNLLVKENSEITIVKDKLIQDKKPLENELSGIKKALFEVQKENVTLTNEKLQLIAEKSALESEKLKLITDKDGAYKSSQAEVAELKSKLSAQQRELKQENDLMLLQLHQVQEELEHYFLENQKYQKTLASQSKRWQRLEMRLHNYLDYDAIRPLSVDSFSETPAVEWQITECTVDGQTLPELNFATYLADGKVGIEIGTNRLTPRALVPQEFRAYSSSEWRRFQIAATAIEYFFANNGSAAQQLPEEFDMPFWRQTLLPLVADVRALPSVFRFTRVQLKRELINPDYEHLWLVFSEASYGLQTWPKFEVRIGAANLQPGAFSKFPKLEFPRIDGKVQPFASWFEESWDDFGGKLELRFDLNKQIADLGVWSKLSKPDQSFLLAFIATLPIAVEQLQGNKVAISRIWADWAGLVNGVIATLRKLMAPAKNESVIKVGNDAVPMPQKLTVKPPIVNLGVPTSVPVNKSKIPLKPPVRSAVQNKNSPKTKPVPAALEGKLKKAALSKQTK
jgi:hypothetical protein